MLGLHQLVNLLSLLTNSSYFTGEHGTVDQTFSSTGRELTLVLTTDSTEARQGFNATYTKLYAGTDLVGEYACTGCMYKVQLLPSWTDVR